MIPGNVIFQLRTSNHHRFRREGNDLHHTMTISLRDALLGFDKVVKQLDGSDIRVHKKKVTKPGEVKVLKGHGMPLYEFPSEFCNLHVKFEIEFPKKLTKAQKKLVRKIFDGPSSSNDDEL